MIGGKMHIACGLDRTLAHSDGWRGPLHIGHPIPAMVRCLQEHLKRGETVTIFSSRVRDYEKLGITAEQVKKVIGDWTEANIGVRLDATNVKLHTFDRIYDDIAVQAVANRGKRVIAKKNSNFMETRKTKGFHNDKSEED